MDLTWLLQALVGNLAWYLLALVGSAVLAFLKTKGSRWAEPALYGVIGFACFVLVFFQIKTFFVINSMRPRVPVGLDNVEAFVKQWADGLHYGLRRLPDEQDHFFAFTVELLGGDQVAVARQRAADTYLVASAVLSVSPQHQEMLQTIPNKEAQQLVSDLRIEMIRLNLEFSNIVLPLRQITIFKHIPITEKLNEWDFASAVNTVNGARLVAREIIVSRLNALTKK